MSKHKYAMQVRELRKIISRIPVEDDDKYLGVLLPYYGRTFSIVAADSLCNIEGQPATKDSPLILIASKRSQS